MKEVNLRRNFLFLFVFLFHLIKKYFLRIERGGIEEFKKDYYSEYLINTERDFYNSLPLFESCINCSLCDLYCSKLSELHRDGLPKISEMILANSVSVEEYRFSFNELDIFDDCKDCLSPCINVCPNDYPIFELISYMRDYNEKLDEI